MIRDRIRRSSFIAGGENHIQHKGVLKMKKVFQSRAVIITFPVLLSMLFLLFAFLSIDAQANSQNQFSVDLNVTPIFTGSEIEIEPCVSVDGLLLVKDVDYTLSYDNNVHATTEAKVYVTGINDYFGYYGESDFSIRKASIENATVTVENATYTSGPLRPNVEVTLNGTVLSERSCYSVQYIDNVHVGYGTARIIGQGDYYGYKDVTFRILDSTTTSTDFNSCNGIVASGTILSGRISTSGQISEGTIKVYHKPFNMNNSILKSSESFGGYYYIYCNEPGTYTINIDYKVREYLGFDISTGRHQYTTRSYSDRYTVICDAYLQNSTYFIGEPHYYGLRNAYLHLESRNDSFAVCDPEWTSSDNTIATVDNGIVTFHKSGTVTVSATVEANNGRGSVVTAEISNSSLDISKHSDIIYDVRSQSYVVTWKDEILKPDVDYTLSVEDCGVFTKATVVGKNLFYQQFQQLFYKNTNMTYICGHIFDNWENFSQVEHSGVCTVCGEKQRQPHVFTNYLSNNDATCTSDGTKTATCDYCDATKTVIDIGSTLPHAYGDLYFSAPGEQIQDCVCGAYNVIYILGWNDWEGNRYFRKEDHTLATGWFAYGRNWYYFEPDGAIVSNRWIEKDNGWCYLGDDGSRVIEQWIKDDSGWRYVDSDGYSVINKWVKDSVGWCHVGADGYMEYNKWVKDSVGWCHVGASGYMEYNKWVKDSVGWCHVGSSGYMEYNKWVKDSIGWCHVGSSGYMEYNKWVKDSVGWCHVGASGYMEYNKWVKDSKGWCYVGSTGYMVTNAWVSSGGNWYYMDANGYMVTGRKHINGQFYSFNSGGIWIG